MLPNGACDDPRLTIVMTMRSRGSSAGSSGASSASMPSSSTSPTPTHRHWVASTRSSCTRESARASSGRSGRGAVRVAVLRARGVLDLCRHPRRRRVRDPAPTTSTCRRSAIGASTWRSPTRTPTTAFPPPSTAPTSSWRRSKDCGSSTRRCSPRRRSSRSTCGGHGSTLALDGARPVDRRRRPGHVDRLRR